MVKGLTTFSLDIEVIEELKKEKNKSNLVNSYLRHYFNLKKKSKEDGKAK